MTAAGLSGLAAFFTAVGMTRSEKVPQEQYSENCRQTIDIISRVFIESGRKPNEVVTPPRGGGILETKTGGLWEWLIPLGFVICMGWVIWHTPALILDFLPVRKSRASSTR